MVHKLALTIGGIASLGVLAFAVAGGDLFPRPAAAQADSGMGGGVATQRTAPNDVVETVVDKVYVAPRPTPSVVRVRVNDPAPPPARTNTAARPPRESENEPAEHEGHEGGGEHDGAGSSEHGDD